MYRLREIEKKDMPTVNKWRNEPELISRLGATYRYINPVVDEKWFDSYMASRNSAVRCAIVDDEQDLILGMISLVSIDHLNQTGELHLMIGEKENRGKGIGTFAINEMLHHAFCNYNLNRIELTVLEDNIPAQHLYEKVGFVREGMKREARFKDGKFINMYIYSILKKEYFIKENKE